MLMADIHENTVPASNQLHGAQPILSLGEPEAPVRLLILGNSITWHRPKADIGWEGDWGMAASSREKDYIHLLADKIAKDGLSVNIRVHQVVSWERNFLDTEELKPFEEDRDFGADVLLWRIGENVKKTACAEDFYEGAVRLLQQISPRAVLFTDCFWHHPVADDVIYRLASERGETCIPLNDLGTDEGMMAVGLFEHHGVSIHPGDEGMVAIADRIYNVLKPMLKGE